MLAIRNSVQITEQSIISKVSENLDIATSASLANTKSMIQTIRRNRNDNQFPEKFGIPDFATKLHTLHINEELFLIHDSSHIIDMSAV